MTLASSRPWMMLRQQLCSELQYVVVVATAGIPSFCTPANHVFLLQTFHPVASQAGDPRRPLSSCHFSPDGNMVATTSWSGTVAVRLLVYAE